MLIFRRCGALYDVVAFGRRTGARRLTMPSRLLTLSPREREIAMLAAAGESNLEIAQTLSVTHKTVEKHLASAYQKLGISSRRNLRSTGIA